MLEFPGPFENLTSNILPLTAANSKVLSFINDTVDDIDAGLGSWPHGEVKVVLKRIAKIPRNNGPTTKASSEGDMMFDYNRVKATCRQMKYAWPGNTPQEAWRFTCILAILYEINTAILGNVTITKRDIFYRQPELFRKQETVDRYIDDIALTCGVTRKDLRVTASPKGLLCGLILSGDSIFDVDNTSIQRIQIVPSDLDTITSHHIEPLRWILVVEKEASFKTLVENNFDTHCSMGVGVIVTAKGYPDLSTRLFLRHVLDLIQAFPSRITIPIFSLVDCDPDGLDIHRCYTSPIRSVGCKDYSAIPELRWLGVDICEWLGNKAVMNRCLVLTKRDRVRARGMLTRMVEAEHFEEVLSRNGQAAQRVETKVCLQTMLILGVKMEIQAVDDEVIAGGLCGWLEARMWDA